MGKFLNALHWIPSYYAGRLLRADFAEPVDESGEGHVYFAICDHFEPYWATGDCVTARRRIAAWVNDYPKVADRFPDDDGRALPYTFFYPEEEYRKEDMACLADLCAAGYAEVEVHLHHDNDHGENLRRTLLDFKRRLRENHGLLGTDARTGEISYGFIHGNWALDNSRCDGRWCGVNGELEILRETGCYADFTLPSAPSETQTKKVNSIYYASGTPFGSKAHDRGKDARAGSPGEGLLLIQGPLLPLWKERRYGFLPRLENGALQSGIRDAGARAKAWLAAGIGVRGARGHRFIKLHSHGAKESASDALLKKGGLGAVLEAVREACGERGLRLHFVSAREMANTVMALEFNERPGFSPRIEAPPLLGGATFFCQAQAAKA